MAGTSQLVRKQERLLRAEEVRLLAELAAEQAVEQAPMGGAAQEAVEIGEASHELEEHDRVASMEATVETLLREVRHALAKIREGTYGLCDTCGKPISEERLIARPQATQCITCRTTQEHHGHGRVSSAPARI